MPRARSPKRDEAFRIYNESHGKAKTKEIAETLNVSEPMISRWKKEDHWDDHLSPKTGAPYGNKNAVGNNGGAPIRNKNAEKHGFYAKYFPDETRDIIESIKDDDLLENLWENIQIQKAIIIRAQRLMHVKDQNDITKEIKKTKMIDNDKGSTEETEYEIQFAWDKHANLMKAQSRAMGTLASMIKQYDEMLRNGFGTEYQKLRLEKLKSEVELGGW